jgi:hypothetical protein
MDEISFNKVKYKKACDSYEELLREYNTVEAERAEVQARRDAITTMLCAANVHKNRCARKLAETKDVRP